MDTTYRLRVLGQTGMYTTGDDAATANLARLAVGSLLRTTLQSNGPQRLGIERCTWTLDANGGPVPTQTVLVEAEETPGQWTIGVPTDA